MRVVGQPVRPLAACSRRIGAGAQRATSGAYANKYSEVYSLFPQETLDTPTRANWPDIWPLAERPGVYLVFGATMQLLYVDKSGTLGRRLSNYFRWSEGKGSSCRVVHTVWKTRPMFVATIAVAEPFEAAALEEYIIAKVHPEENYLLIAAPVFSSASLGG